MSVVLPVPTIGQDLRPRSGVNSSVLMNNRPLLPLDDLREADHVMQREAVSEPQACPDLVTTYCDGRCLAA
jgi:hypothetical protein